jgi:hypothetical protein
VKGVVLTVGHRIGLETTVRAGYGAPLTLYTDVRTAYHFENAVSALES